MIKTTTAAANTMAVIAVLQRTKTMKSTRSTAQSACALTQTHRGLSVMAPVVKRTKKVTATVTTTTTTVAANTMAVIVVPSQTKQSTQTFARFASAKSKGHCNKHQRTDRIGFFLLRFMDRNHDIFAILTPESFLIEKE